MLMLLFLRFLDENGKRRRNYPTKRSLRKQVWNHIRTTMNPDAAVDIFSVRKFNTGVAASEMFVLIIMPV